jgi:hypothetical protein
MQDTGKWIVILGCIAVVFGILVYFFGDKLSFLDNLPGDIKVDRENFKFYFPITTMILVSVVINLVIRLIKHLNG